MQHPSGYHKLRLGWLAPGRAVTATASGTYTIAPLEAASGIAVLRVPSGAGSAVLLRRLPPAERRLRRLRPRRSRDRRRAGPHRRRPVGWTRPRTRQLLDGTPGTDGFADATFVPGTAFDDGAGARVAVVWPRRRRRGQRRPCPSTPPRRALRRPAGVGDAAAHRPPELEGGLRQHRRHGLRGAARRHAARHGGRNGARLRRRRGYRARRTPIACAPATPAATSAPPARWAWPCPTRRRATTPTGLKAVVLSATSVRLTWSASRDDGTLRGYYVVGAPRQLMLGPVTAATVTGLRDERVLHVHGRGGRHLVQPLGLGEMSVQTSVSASAQHRRPSMQTTATYGSANVVPFSYENIAHGILDEDGFPRFDVMNDFSLGGLDSPQRTTIQGPDATAFSTTQPFFTSLSGLSGSFNNVMMFHAKTTRAPTPPNLSCYQTDANAASGALGEVYGFRTQRNRNSSRRLQQQRQSRHCRLRYWLQKSKAPPAYCRMIRSAARSARRDLTSGEPVLVNRSAAAQD